VAIVGDFDSASSIPAATVDALAHAATELESEVDASWVPTLGLEAQARAQLDRAHAVFAAPGSPYRSLEGALAGSASRGRACDPWSPPEAAFNMLW
jgi:CTP synthase (UTP-ammonia lyase)